MGCDIHDIIQVKQSDGTWKKVTEDIYTGRSYSLFGMLAGVRMRFGINPISQPRGFPEDFTVSCNSPGSYAHEGYWIGEHSHSWVTLAELQDYAINLEPELKEIMDRLIELIQTSVGISTSSLDVRYVFGFDS